VVAEREFISIQRVRFMENRIGEEFEGVVSGVAGFGFFVELKDVFVEGLVRVADLSDYYMFQEERLMLVGKRSGKVFRLGTPVKVKLVGASALKGQIDFQLIEEKQVGHRGGPDHGQNRDRGRRRRR
jgi:ribonuclease R